MLSVPEPNLAGHAASAPEDQVSKLFNLHRRGAFAEVARHPGVLAVLGGLHAMNPDAFVVRWNLARPGSERPFDAQYAAELGADAAPALVDALPSLAPADRCVIVTRLRSWARADGDWRSWNLARARARRLAQEHAAAFDALCPDPEQSLPGG